MHIKVWSKKAILCTGIIFTPFSAIVLEAMNYRAVRRSDEVKRSLIWFSALLLVVMVAPSEIFQYRRVTAGFSFVLLAIWYFARGRYFGARIAAGALDYAKFHHPLLIVPVGVATCIGLFLIFSIVGAVYGWIV